MNRLQQQQRIQNGMSIEDFLNSPEEAIQGLKNTSNIEEEIAAQIDVQ